MMLHIPEVLTKAEVADRLAALVATRLTGG